MPVNGGVNCDVTGCTRTVLAGYQQCRRHGGGQSCIVDGCSTGPIWGWVLCRALAARFGRAPAPQHYRHRSAAHVVWGGRAFDRAQARIRAFIARHGGRACTHPWAVGTTAAPNMAAADGAPLRLRVTPPMQRCKVPRRHPRRSHAPALRCTGRPSAGNTALQSGCVGAGRRARCRGRSAMHVAAWSA